MRTDTTHIIARSDYRPYPYSILQVRLFFDLDKTTTRVRAELDVRRRGEKPEPMILNGEALTMRHLAINGRTLNPEEYVLTDHALTLHPTDSSFTLTISSECHPADNTALMGLYASGDHLFTQCEAEGFRRIVWFPDRPDVMSTYRVTLRGDKAHYPLLLSNGNLVSERDLGDGRHEAVWDDPHPKPSYLFALVAGNFRCREKSVQTRSGRRVQLQVYSDEPSADKTAWALECLERAMRWDEQTWGLELDLDRFMIVAARDFNMGAMENKGLNVFNSAYVLASPDTATDANYRTVEAVIGHEYFHNWTGNRVTCRDWFQLSLKEGLTVFREQEFSADMLAESLEGDAARSARAVKRIDDVDILRSSQFPEDAGPMAHPVRPESYHEISNFYTATIYEKGAEVIRMLHRLLGHECFREGLDEYFRRHDGQAVTCDDFLDAMEYAWQLRHPERDLNTFRHWYNQAGTPRITLNTDYDPISQTCTITLAQRNEHAGIERLETPLRPKPPLHIPVAIGFMNPHGSTMPAPHDGTTLLELTESTNSWTFTEMPERPIISALRGFSAPVILESDTSEAEQAVLAMHDPDPFARWEAIQALASAEIIRHTEPSLAQAATRGELAAITLTHHVVEVWQQLLTERSIAPDYRARALRLVSAKQMLLKQKPADPQSIVQAHASVHAQLGTSLSELWLAAYNSCQDVAARPYRPDPLDAGQRALRSLALAYLLSAEHDSAVELARTQYWNANNLTDRLGALNALTRFADPACSHDILDDFFGRAGSDEQLMDAWFSVQATAHWATVDSIEALMAHPEFSIRNPNRARALIFQFCLNNLAAIHTPAGYTFWADQILALDRLNPEIAARLARGLDNWAHFAEPARAGMRTALETLRDNVRLSPNVSEIVNKTLTIESE